MATTIYDDVDDELFLRAVPKASLESLGRRREEIEHRMLESTEISLSLLGNCESVGLATCEELVRQRDSLQATERRLDYIHAATRLNRRYLRNMSSLVSTVRSFLFGRSSAKRLEKETAAAAEAARPSVRGQDGGKSAPKELSDVSSTDLIDRNLTLMKERVTSIRDLSLGMSSELDLQSPIIDNITDKTETAGYVIHKQNNQIKKMLK